MKRVLIGIGSLVAFVAILLGLGALRIGPAQGIVRGWMVTVPCAVKGGELSAYLEPYPGLNIDPRPWVQDGVVLHPEGYDVWCVKKDPSPMNAYVEAMYQIA